MISSLTANAELLPRIPLPLPRKLQETPQQVVDAYQLSTQQQAQAQELQVLIGLYDSTSGDEWVANQGWLANGVIPCNWEGVLCNANNYVTALEFPDNNLVGTLPASMLWDGLQYLERVDLSQNPELVVDFSSQVSLSWDSSSSSSSSVVNTEDTTPIPSVILTNETANMIVNKQPPAGVITGISVYPSSAPIQHLDISYTTTRALKGMERIVNSLQFLDVSMTSITKDAMDVVRGLSELTTLRMNNLSGLNASSDGFFSNAETVLPNLQYWYASNASLTGTMPSLAGMSNLQLLDWSNNLLEGTLSSLNNLPNLEELFLQQSPQATKRFTGVLPDMAALPQLRQMDLSYHKFSGRIPATLLSGIENKTLPLYVNLQGNDLVGFVPSSLASFAALFLDVSSNYISSLPQDLCAQDGWMDGAVADFGCAAILCPPRTYNEFGRQVSEEIACEDCNAGGGALFFGSTTCEERPQLDLVMQAEEAPGVMTQKDILVAFYNATDGPEWTDSEGWLETEGPFSDECRWYGVECQGGSVRSITLPNNNLQGGTPMEFFQFLPFLRRLVLTGNPDLEVDFTGLPPTGDLEDLLVSNTATFSLLGISNARNLQDLEIIGTQISGPNLGELYSLTTLKTLNMGNNNLDQVLPEAIGQLSQLVTLRAPNAALFGTLPNSLGQLTDLVILDLAENSLVAPVDTALNQLDEVRILDLHAQEPPLVTPLPALEGMGSLLQLDLSGNALTGQVPTNFLGGISDKFRSLDVNLKGNQLTGTLPLELALFQEMNLDITDNRIEDIPDVLCIKEDWMKGSVADYGCDAILCPPGTHNEAGRMVLPESPCEACPDAPYFGSVQCPMDGASDATGQTSAPSGPVVLSEREILELLFEATGGSTSWVQKDNWLDDNVDVCEWFGVGCDTDARVESLDLSENGLMQSTPEELFQLSRLERLFLDNNPDLTVELSGIGLVRARARLLKGGARSLQESSLRALVLSNTSTASLAGIEKASGLQVLDLNRTRISSDDLGFLMTLTSLQSLDIGNTRINQAIPDTIANLSELRELAASNAGITGTIPQSLAQITGLMVLDLSINTLIGTLPAFLGELTDLRILDLHDQGLSSGGGIGGRILPFDTLPALAKIDLSENRLSGEIPLTFLSGVFNKDAPLDARLRGNALRGSLPESLASFAELNIDVTTNFITDLPDSFCLKELWMDGNTGSFGCDGILCPPRTYNSNGRQVSTLEPCVPCPIDPNPYYGAISCLDAPEVTDGDTMICPDGSVCYNHGVCLQSAVDPGSYACDCTVTNAYGIPFVGLSCEYKATDFCHTSGFSGTHNISSFCANNGLCVERVTPGSEHVGCNCNDDLWNGDYCELRKDSETPNDVPMKATVDITQICPDDHICENGSQCVESTVYDGTFECDCAAIDDNQLPVAGESCQYPATSLCSLSSPFTSFCVNGGACVSLVQGTADHADCLCPEGFSGRHCEEMSNIGSESQFFVPSSADDGGMEGWEMALVFVVPALAILIIVAMIVAAYSKARKKNLKYVNVDALADSEYEKYATEDLESPKKSSSTKKDDLSESDTPPSIVDRALTSIPGEENLEISFFSLPDSPPKKVQVEEEEGTERTDGFECAAPSRPPAFIETGESPTTSISKSSDAEDSPVYATTLAGAATGAAAAAVVTSTFAARALNEESDAELSEDEEIEELSTILEGTEGSSTALHPLSPQRASRGRDGDVLKSLPVPMEEPPHLGNSSSRRSSINSRNSINSVATEEFRDALTERPRVCFGDLPSDDESESNNVSTSFIGDIDEINGAKPRATGKSLFAGVQSGEDSVSFLDHSVGMSDDSERSNRSFEPSQIIQVSVEPGLAESMFGGRREASETSSGELSLNF